MSGIVNKVKEALHSDSHKHDNNIPEGTHGPHGSRVANAADPRVDSDLDSTGRHTGVGRTAGHGEFGNTATGAGVTGTGHSAATGTGYGAATGAGYGAETGTGVTGSAHHAAGTGVTGVTGTHGAPTGTHGPHSSRVANAADPRVDSDRDGRAALGTGPGPAPNTAGPHSNDYLNKADPRVDSDMDGSRTVGGNKTYQ